MGNVCTLGEAMVTFTSTRIGPLRAASTASISMAGSEATVAIGVRRLGHSATWIGRVGRDELGVLVRGRILGEGVHVPMIDGPEPTGVMLKERLSAGARRVHYYRSGSAAAAIAPADLPRSLIESADIFHSSGITAALSDTSLATLDAAIDIARAASTVVSFDLNFRERLWTADEARLALLPLLARVDILFASLDEAQLVLATDESDPLVLAEKLQQVAGPNDIVITDGAAGAWWRSATTSGFAPATPTVEIDPFGAGDAFVGGYLASILDGLSAGESAARASRVAAVAVATEGDWEGLPDASTELNSPSAASLIRR